MCSRGCYASPGSNRAPAGGPGIELNLVDEFGLPSMKNTGVPGAIADPSWRVSSTSSTWRLPSRRRQRREQHGQRLRAYRPPVWLAAPTSARSKPGERSLAARWVHICRYGVQHQSSAGRLTPVRELEAVLDAGPAACGHEDQCWTLARIAEVVC